MFYSSACFNSPASQFWPRAGLVMAWATLALLGMTGLKAEPPSELQMSDQSRVMLETILGEPRMTNLRETLSVAGAWGSLGPRPTGEAATFPIPRPEREIVLSIPEDARGTGTANDPYIDLISDFLDQFEYQATSIEAYRGYPAEGVVEAYVESLSYEPTVVRLPAGHYHETVTLRESPHRHYETRRVAVDVPPGIWLEGDGEVVIKPVVELETSSILINLNIRSGLLNLSLDGSSVPGFEPTPATRVTAVSAAHQAVIAGNHIREFTGSGVVASGSRGRAGSDVAVIDNIIETIGYTGIRGQSRWLISDNQIAYAGLLRPTGGGRRRRHLPGLGSGWKNRQ